MRHLFILFLVFFISLNINAQGVGINSDGSAPDASAILDLKSTNKALILTRVVKSNINNPKKGMIIFNTVDDKLYYYDGSGWKKLSHTLLKDADGDTRIDVEETVDSDYLKFTAKDIGLFEMTLNNENSPILSTPNHNVLIGKNAASNISNNNAASSIAIGENALDGPNNYIQGVYIGENAGTYLSNGSVSNVFIGYASGGRSPAYTQLLNNNVGIGSFSLVTATGKDNVVVGQSAGLLLEGDNNTLLGSEAGKELKGSNNIAIGENTLTNTVGNKNIIIGDSLLQNNTASGKLIIDAYSSGTPLLSGDFNKDSLNVHNILSIGDGIGSKLYIGNDYIKDGGAQILRTHANFTPNSNNTFNLGGSSFKWKHLFMQGNLNIGTSLIKEDGTDILRTDSHFTPTSNGIKNLGDISHSWNDLYLKGDLKFETAELWEVDQKIIGTNSSIQPQFSYSDQSLGTGSRRWSSLHLHDTIFLNAIKIFGSSALEVDKTFRPHTDATQNLGSNSKRWNNIYALNSTIVTSDKRTKKNIENLSYGLNSLMKIKTYTYNWNQQKNNDKKHIGVIAQELLEIIPEVVNVPDEDEGENMLLGVSYNELIPVLIKSIQEQQEQIKSLENKIKALEP